MTYVKFFVILLFIFSLVGAKAQGPKDVLANETSLKDFIDSNIKKLGYDPLEGIYDATNDTQLYLEGKLFKNQISKHRYGIVRLGGEYKVYRIGHGLYPLEFITTSVPDNYQVLYSESANGRNYISKGSAIQMGTTLKIVIEVNREYIRDYMKDLYSQYVESFIEIFMHKKYPLANDLIIINEEAVKSAPKSGTGFAILNRGVVVTNFHVIENAKSIQVRGVNGDFTKTYNAEIKQKDISNDLAILTISDPLFTSTSSVPYKIKTTPADIGEDIFVLGYPLTATMGEDIKLVTGIISSKTGYQGNVSQYQISAPLQPGNSGGPLFDKSGNIIGIVSSKHLDTENVGYAIKTLYLQSILDLLPDKIPVASATVLNNKSLTEQVKIVKNFIYIIEVN